jgi:hypothetical protein
MGLSFSKNKTISTNTLQLTENNEIYKKINNKNMDNYFTWNSDIDKPYSVYIGKTVVNIYEYDHNKYFDPFRSLSFPDRKYGYTKFVAKYNPIKIFIGKSESDPRFQLAGNTILLKIKKNRYVYIGENIFEFDSESEITEYHSIVDRNVPYPVAVCEKNLYFMLDKKFIQLEKLPFLNKKKKIEAYGLFYYNDKYSNLKKKMKSIKKIS